MAIDFKWFDKEKYTLTFASRIKIIIMCYTKYDKILNNISIIISIHLF